MGVAAYNRGSSLIRRQHDTEMRPVEWEIMDRLNALPRYQTAQAPFETGVPLRISRGNGGWWIECGVTGFGFWYRTLHKCVKSWRITIVGYENGDWLADPA